MRKVLGDDGFVDLVAIAALRALLDDYHFTDTDMRRKEGAWWRRELKGVSFPPAGIREETR